MFGPPESQRVGDYDDDAYFSSSVCEYRVATKIKFILSRKTWNCKILLKVFAKSEQRLSSENQPIWVPSNQELDRITGVTEFHDLSFAKNIQSQDVDWLQ